jgi:hypothetical protein
MDQVSWRRRPDGVLEIVRPTWWRRPGSLRTGAALALALLVLLSGFALVPAAGATPSIAVASAIVAGCGAVAAARWRSSRRRGRQAPAGVARRASAR